MSEVRRRENGGPQAVPPLSVVFANSVYAVRGVLKDTVDTPEKLDAWLDWNEDAIGVIGVIGALADPEPDPDSDADPDTDAVSTPVSAADLAVFLTLRDAIRALIGAVVNEVPVDREALAVLNRCAARVPTWPELTHGQSSGFGLQLHGSPRRFTDAVLGALARDAIDLLAGEDRDLLRACRAPGCVQFFLKDHPRRNWCSPACGNRARVANHHARARAAAQTDA